MNTMTAPASLAEDQSLYQIGSRITIVAGPYAANMGKILEVRDIGLGFVEATPINRANTLRYSDGFSNHMELGPGEIAVLNPEHVRLAVS